MQAAYFEYEIEEELSADDELTFEGQLPAGARVVCGFFYSEIDADFTDFSLGHAAATGLAKDVAKFVVNSAFTPGQPVAFPFNIPVIGEVFTPALTLVAKALSGTTSATGKKLKAVVFYRMD